MNACGPLRVRYQSDHLESLQYNTNTTKKKVFYMLQATLIIPMNDIRFGQTGVRELKRIKLKTAVTADLLAGNYPLHSQLGVGPLRLCCPSLFCIKGTKVESGVGGFIAALPLSGTRRGVMPVAGARSPSAPSHPASEMKRVHCHQF